MPAKPVDSNDPIVQRLRALVTKSHELKDAAQVYESILPLLRDADLGVGPVSLAAGEARAKMEQGLPLLHDLDLDLDVEAARELMLKLAAAIEAVTKKSRPRTVRLPWLAASSEPESAARRMRMALEEKKLDVNALLNHVTAGESGPVSSAARSLDLDPDLVWTLAQNAFKPALRALCRQISPLARGIPWNKGVCFVCGAPAALGELQDNDLVKHLRCGSCGADWQFRRMQCMYCGNEDHKTQRFLYAEKEQEKMRVEVCDKCHGYLKVISSFAPTSPEMLPVEDLATIHLDYIAREHGYTRVNVQ
jgi:FdhE protein